MSNGLLLLSIGLTAVVGSLCTLLYTKIKVLIDTTQAQSKKIGHLEIVLKSVIDIQKSTQLSVNELGTEIQLREVYQTADDRHQIAIKDAKQGKSHAELVRQHGLSSDEAALIVALHGHGAAGMNGHDEVSKYSKTRRAEAALTER